MRGPVCSSLANWGTAGRVICCDIYVIFSGDHINMYILWRMAIFVCIIAIIHGKATSSKRLNGNNESYTLYYIYNIFISLTWKQQDKNTCRQYKLGWYTVLFSTNCMENMSYWTVSGWPYRDKLTSIFILTRTHQYSVYRISWRGFYYYGFQSWWDVSDNLFQWTRGSICVFLLLNLASQNRNKN